MGEMVGGEGSRVAAGEAAGRWQQRRVEGGALWGQITGCMVCRKDKNNTRTKRRSSVHHRDAPGILNTEGRKPPHPVEAWV